MRAVTLTAEGEPASLIDLPDPDVPSHGAVVEVRAASVNGFDVFQVGGGLMGMMPHALPTIVGRDLSGVVVAVGSERTDVQVGDEVLGFITSTPPLQDGTWAELAVSDAKLVLARKPPTLDWQAAAAIPLAGATALSAVDAIEPSPGDHVLIMGATGGVGAFAIQFAAARGARVIASAKPGDGTDFVRDLGAHDVVDYTRRGLDETIRGLVPDGVHGLIDLVNRGDAFASMAALVRRGGRVATTLGAADVETLAGLGIVATNVMGSPTPDNMAMLADQAAAGTLRVPVRATFALEDFGAAVASFAAGTVGKIVLRVG